MFQRLYDLSSFFPANQESWQYLNEGMSAKYNRGFAIHFSKDGQWLGIETNHLTENEFHSDVVFRSGTSPNGPNMTPCCKIAKHTTKKMFLSVNKLLEYKGLPDKKRQSLETSIQCFKARQDEIWQAVENKIASSDVDDKGKCAFVYWKIGSQAVYDWQETKTFLVEKFLDTLAKGGTRTGTCSVCGQTEQKVYGNYSVLACYNLDKPGSIAGGFVETQAHRNFPVCQSCAFSIAQAFTFVKNHLTGNMAGQQYMVLPYASMPEIREELYESLRKQPERFLLHNAKGLVAEETQWLEDFGTQGEQFALAVIFFHSEPGSAAWRLQAEVQQLLPSRMAELHEAFLAIEKADDLATDFKKEYKPLQISASTFQHFSGNAEKDSANTLRAWLIALFEKRAIDEKHFLHNLVSKIISIGKKNLRTSSKKNLVSLEWTVQQAWGLYRYALLTGLIQLDNTKGDKNMSIVLPNNSVYGYYLNDNIEFFDNQEKVVAFLVGCHASIVTYVQREVRKLKPGQEPFAKKLIGRFFTQNRLHRLDNDCREKLNQYIRMTSDEKLRNTITYAINKLALDLSEAWIVADKKPWTISPDEATFAFNIGYSLQRRIPSLYAKTNETDTEE